MRKTLLTFFTAPLLLTLAAGCSGEAENPPPGTVVIPGTEIPGTEIPSTELGAEQKAELDQLIKEKEATANLTAEDFAKKYSVPFSAGISYDATQAEGMALIQASAHKLDADELAKLKDKGFVISDKQNFPTFMYGYESIYAQDLPLYVSADSILYAVHNSYDAILKAVEMASLSPELEKMLGEMRSKLAAGAAAGLDPAARADADLLTAVGLSLLTGKPVAPVAGASPDHIEKLVKAANDHAGMIELTIFGSKRLEDFSQFEPRGHYTETEELKRYFRSMMWLGRIDLRIIETQQDGSQVFRRRQLEGAYVLRALADGATMDRYTRIDSAIQAFVGESDYMQLPHLDSLLKDLGIADASALKGVTDAKIAQTMVAKQYGTQRISSHIMINGLDNGTMPLSSSFALLGQRYVVDSHVFSNVVYDRVQRGTVKRMMPNPLDVGFAALGNNQAGLLLDGELTQYKYSPDLHMMRVLVDAHPQQFWGMNLYNGWLTGLRELSPSTTLADTNGLPEVAKTEAWGRRLLNTQLASWAELRHDTLLYAKQSYTSGNACEFPDAYVDPYPGFFQRIADLAEQGGNMVGTLDLSADPNLAARVPAYFAKLRDVAQMLGEMAKNERAGLPLTPEQLAFINDAVKIQWGCGDPEGASGWYPQLFFSTYESVQRDPTIADVHTQPTDEGGNPVGRVLHVGTGAPRLMVVTADTCGTPRAFVGLASSYFEKVTENFDRMTDEQWASDILESNPADVPWMQDLVVR
ncbi:DUF3160 domain-containing protein [Polyangium aurulentum]|uniref:DUF3160 domain-containing protein n=1 Tax=Polyangium aurulentum TaxID=2567896 RepID=UPI0010AE01E6|nr:DUF3160 domain-containing protein [Polyangium aurulentum]UQA58319.1 DUF3160 domain-containing protein [Polyangium aurulentum]